MQANFEEFVAARGHALLRFAYLLTSDRHLAEDLVQEALLRTHRRWSSIESTYGPEPYVRKAVLRAFLSWRRRRASGEITIPEPPDTSVDERLAERAVERDAMWGLLGQLSKAQRAVLVLRYYEDLPDVEIAQMLGCSPATVRVHAHKALGRLRQELSADAAAVSPSAKSLKGA